MANSIRDLTGQEKNYFQKLNVMLRKIEEKIKNECSERIRFLDEIYLEILRFEIMKEIGVEGEKRKELRSATLQFHG